MHCNRNASATKYFKEVYEGLEELAPEEGFHSHILSLMGENYVQLEDYQGKLLDEKIR